MRKRRPPVYMEQGFKEALENGGILEIECLSPVTQKSSEIVGEWWIYVRETFSGEVVRTALCATRHTHPRLIKTSRGVVMLATKLGATVVCVPVVEGKIGVCEVEFPDGPGS
ncbi:MAG: hypothetical protein AAGA97_01095 [Pseudomonadota bacterium]